MHGRLTALTLHSIVVYEPAAVEASTGQRVSFQRGDHLLKFSRQPYIVSIKKGQVLAGRTANAGITSRARTAIALGHDLNATAILLENFDGGVGRTIIYDHYCVPLEVLKQDTLDSLNCSTLGNTDRYYC